MEPLDDPRYRAALERYRELLGLVRERRDAVERFARWLEDETSWLSAPASTKYHLNVPGGLLIHSVGVTETLLRIKSCISPAYSDESCVIVGLFHDVGKVGAPGMPYYIPNPDEAMRQTEPYIVNPDVVTMGMGVRSLYIVSRFVPLSDEEAQAICYHDGQYIPENRVVALKERPLLLLLHFADLWTSMVIEGIDRNQSP